MIVPLAATRTLPHSGATTVIQPLPCQRWSTNPHALDSPIPRSRQLTPKVIPQRFPIRTAFITTVLLLAATRIQAQTPPGQPIPDQAGILDTELRESLKNRIELGRAAREAGRYAEARDHFISALEFAPASTELLRDLLATSVGAGDADARILWAIRYWASSADERGRFTPDSADRALLPKNVIQPKALALARVAAVAELAKFARTSPRGRAGTGHSVMVRWASDLAWELMRDAPALHTLHGPVFNAACKAQVADYSTTLQALRKVLSGSIKPKPIAQDMPVSDQELDEAIIRAARCLTGMAAQTRFKPPPLQDRKEPLPAMDRDSSAARQARSKIRQKINQRIGEPITLTQLREMSVEERELFTVEHATWANPGLAVSPTGMYRIETICGFQTLLGVTETVEMHHQRLADFFGKDPFGERQGLVRVVPASSGLESEDSPFWWAGGFQSGDQTTVKFNWSNHSSLGHTLTHELTHRFDGTIFPFLPSWLVEGKAVWTGGSYQYAEDKSFVDHKLNIGPCTTAYTRGYSGEHNLKRLIEGKLDDYRANYTAGYALYWFLSAWRKDGKELFAGQLEKFMKNARGGIKNPLGWFVSIFADGKEGRPENFKAFTSEFNMFLSGCYKSGWGEAPPWMREYRTKFPKRPRPPRQGRRQPDTVMDEPTWIWVRNRAEPQFGQRHAAAAGTLLAELGQEKAAVAALLWWWWCAYQSRAASRRLSRGQVGGPSLIAGLAILLGAGTAVVSAAGPR